MSAVLEKYGQAEVGNDANYSKFHHLAKDHFQIKIKNDYDYINGVKESIRFFSLDLPAGSKKYLFHSLKHLRSGFMNHHFSTKLKNL